MQSTDLLPQPSLPRLGRDSPQNPQFSKLLHLSLFAIAAHYAERGRTGTTTGHGDMPGEEYAVRARTILS